MAGRWAATIAVVIAILALVGCSPGSTGANRHGPATLTVVGKDVGCCYIEGSRHFAQLKGPTTREWAMDQPLPLASAQDLNEPQEVGSVTFEIDPGDYVATFWQRPCDGNCGNLDPVSSQCRVTFPAQAGTSIRIDVTFPLHDQCVAVVS